jgi:hypothetical protein
VDPSTPNAFRTWLFSDAGAGWALWLLTLVTWGIAFARRKRASRITVVQIERASLVRRRSAYSDLIDVTFAGDPVNNLGETQILVTNEGSEVIRNIVLTMSFPTTTKVLHAIPHSTTDEETPAGWQLETADHELTLRLPYLNPFKEHKHGCRLSLFVDGFANGMTVSGGGAGWSVSYLPALSPKQELRNARATLWFAVGASALGVVYAMLMPRLFNISPNEVSLRSLLLSTPAVALLFAAGRVASTRLVRIIQVIARRKVASAADDTF